MRKKTARHRRVDGRCVEMLGELEPRVLLSATPASRAALAASLQALIARLRTSVAVTPQKSGPVGRPGALVAAVSPNVNAPNGSAITPIQMTTAYGVNEVTFGALVGDGAGQTIAIIDAYDDPNAASDLHAFDQFFGLEDPPSFTQVNQRGGSQLPGTDPAGKGSSWELEESLDIEWAHVIAPKANIVLVEADDNSFPNLVQAAVGYARTISSVSVISMSFGAAEFEGEDTLDDLFVTPAGHRGITFIASTGDTGAPGEYPAYSPNVVAVGGTSLTLNGNAYGSESGWSEGGGGVSSQELLPSYQAGIGVSTGRATPDVSMDADLATGVAVYDSYDFGDNPWLTVGGTSLATPMWGGIIAVANQGRTLAGLGTLNTAGQTQTLPALYALPAADFHDIVTGSNGFPAGPGYDMVTGLGSPVANLLIADLVGVGSISGTVYRDNNGDAMLDNGETGIAGVTVFLDRDNDGMLDTAPTQTATATGLPIAIPDAPANNTGALSTVQISAPGATVTSVTISFSIAHTYDRDLIGSLIAPDGTSITLFSRIGGSQNNFTNTVLDDSAASAISTHSAPFTGTFKPSGGTLSTFIGKNATGTWTFKVVDVGSGDTGSITAFSLTLGLSAEASTTTDANGAYALGNLVNGLYTVRQLVPANFIQTEPDPGVLTVTPPPPLNVMVRGTVLGQNFGDFPTVITADSTSTGYSINLDPATGRVQIFAGVNTPPFAGVPAFSILLSDLPSLTINFNGDSQVLAVDFSGGNFIPAGGLTLNGNGGTNSDIEVYGSSSATQVSLTDTSVSDGGGTLSWVGLGSIGIHQVTAVYHGTGEALPALTIWDNAVLQFAG